MATSLKNFMSGSYQVEWGGATTADLVNLGKTEVGFEMIIRPSVTPVRADNTGRTPVQGIWTGIEDLIIRIDGIQWAHTTGSASSSPWSAMMNILFEGDETDTNEGRVQVAGSLMSALSDTLVLTPLTGPAVDAQNGGIYTFLRTYPLEPVRTVFSSQRLRSASMGFYVFAQATASATNGAYAKMYTADYTA